MLNTAQIDQFHRQGFLNGGLVLDEEEVAELRDSLAAILAKGPGGFGTDETPPGGEQVARRRLQQADQRCAWRKLRRFLR